MAALGYGFLTDRAFVSFEREMDEDPWKSISTKKFEDAAKDNAASLLTAPQLVVFKLRLRMGIANVLAAIGATPLGKLDVSWDAAQRRLFHRIAVHVDDEDRDVRDSADRLSAELLSGSGTAQTQLDFDAEVDFGRRQIALTSEGGPLAADAKKIKLADALGEVAKTTEALAKGLGRDKGAARKAPSRKLRDALAECAAAFTSVHGQLAWFIDHTPPGADRDQLTALLGPLERLLERNQPATKGAVTEPPAEPEAPPAKGGTEGDGAP